MVNVIRQLTFADVQRQVWRKFTDGLLNNCQLKREQECARHWCTLIPWRDPKMIGISLFFEAMKHTISSHR